MIKIDGITKNYDKTVIEGLSLHVKRGEFFGLLGPNGAGKTTTIRLLMALTNLSSGSIKINNITVSRDNSNYKAQIGLVPQHINLEPELTVRENLQLHGLLYKMSKEDIKKKIEELLLFTELTEKADSVVNYLSGGMKRKLLIARALMHNPTLLFLDEPTVGLDVFSRRRVWDLIKSLHAKGLTIVLTTHYLEEAEALCTRIGLLKEGKLLMTGSMEELRNFVGPVVIEVFHGEKETKLYFFQNQKDALSSASDIKEKFTIRQTKLEDVFVKLTGEKSD